MTKCNTDRIALGCQGRRRIEADFAGGRLVSDGGLLLLRMVDQRLGLTAALGEVIGDPRDPARIEHEQAALLAQRIHALAAGYEDLNDHLTLRHDPALQLCADVQPLEGQTLASPSTLCRLEQRITRGDCVRMHEVLVDQFIESHQNAPEELILDFDATDDPLHGRQEGRFFHGYYGHYCYLPLYVFCGEQLLCAYLRPSKIDPTKHAWAILKLLAERLRAAWPTTRIIFRGDSGFCRWRMMRWCDQHGVGYVIGIGRNTVLERLAQPWTVPARWHAQRTDQKVRLFGAFSYAAGTWDRSRKVIVKAECMPRPVGQCADNPRFIVTNLPGDPVMLYDRLYCQRGEMENRIKEQQLGLFADRTSCATLAANQFRLLLSSAAYVLMQTLRQTALAGTSLARAQVTTIRTTLLKIAARVVVSVRRIVLHLSSTHPLQPLLRRIAHRLHVPAYDTG